MRRTFVVPQYRVYRVCGALVFRDRLGIWGVGVMGSDECQRSKTIFANRQGIVDSSAGQAK